MFDNLDILFLGRLFSRKNEKEIRAKARVDMQDAANVLQWNLIDGFVANGCKKMNVVSYLPIDSWPSHYQEAFVKNEIHTISDSVRFHQVGFCNITKIKQILNKRICNKAAKKWASDNNGKKKVIVCYTCNNVLMRAIREAKKVNPDIVSVQVIADITEFATNNNPSFIQKLYIKNQIQTNDALSGFIDKYVLLTKLMKDKLGIIKPYMVMEGIVPPREKTDNTAKNDVKTILYTGSLNKKYGIMELLAAFEAIESPNYQLIICGLGNAEEDIKALAATDSRIDFRGRVPHSEVLKLQSEVTVLVNPRQNNEEFTKYSFPSKTMEYLASGTPVIAYKLDGIPDEYDDYITYVEDDSAECLARNLMQICEIDETTRAEIGKRAAEFVLLNKNAKVQTRRILDFINNNLG